MARRNARNRNTKPTETVNVSGGEVSVQGEMNVEVTENQHAVVEGDKELKVEPVEDKIKFNQKEFEQGVEEASKGKKESENDSTPAKEVETADKIVEEVQSEKAKVIVLNQKRSRVDIQDDSVIMLSKKYQR